MRMVDAGHLGGGDCGGRDDFRVDAVEQMVSDIEGHFPADVADEPGDDDASDRA
jgi:hypothetical protein